MVQGSYFVDGDLKFRHILVTELKFKLSPKSFAHIPGMFQEYQKDLCLVGNRNGEIGLRRTLVFTLSETGAYSRHWGRGGIGSDLILKYCCCIENRLQGRVGRGRSVKSYCSNLGERWWRLGWWRERKSQWVLLII